MFPEPLQTIVHPYQDDSGFLLSNDIPNIDADEHALANGIATTAAASSSSAQQMESFSASASFKQLGRICYSYTTRNLSIGTKETCIKPKPPRTLYI